jgi:hypothetical protein
MTIDYSTKGKVKITMMKYIKGILEELPHNMAGESETPTASTCIR